MGRASTLRCSSDQQGHGVLPPRAAHNFCCHCPHSHKGANDPRLPDLMGAPQRRPFSISPIPPSHCLLYPHLLSQCFRSGSRVPTHPPRTAPPTGPRDQAKNLEQPRGAQDLPWFPFHLNTPIPCLEDVKADMDQMWLPPRSSGPACDVQGFRNPLGIRTAFLCIPDGGIGRAFWVEGRACAKACAQRELRGRSRRLGAAS